MKIILQNTQPLLGDRLMFTPCVRDLKAAKPDWQIDVRSAGPDVWLNNPHLTPLADAEKICNVGPAKVTKGSKTNNLHITSAFRVSLQEQLGFEIPQGPHKADLHLSEDERRLSLIDGPYWVVNIDTGPMTAKRWPPERFQQVVNSLSGVTFVQVGLTGDNQVRLKGANVIDLVGRTTVRELFVLVYHSAGCLSLVSSLMHVAGAFDKPCVVIAGGREPPTFERYPMHRYIDTVGALECCRDQACWKNALSACKQAEPNGHARCMNMIGTSRVVGAVEDYYTGGRLTRSSAKPVRRRPLIRIVTKSVTYGGAERSAVQIARQFDAVGWRVQMAGQSGPHPAMAADLPPGVQWTQRVTAPCDCLLLYASDMVFNFQSPEYDCFRRLNAGRKVMALTYKIGKAGEIDWTRDWDYYLFLSSALQKGFLKKHQAPTDVLAPAVDLAPFLAVTPNYEIDLKVRIVRHSSQPDKKYPNDLPDVMQHCPDAIFYFMPGPPWPADNGQVVYCPPQPDPAGVANFLQHGQCYWYLLPDGYTDQGPRTIVEAMAAGLPVIAESRDGPADRVTSDTGWLIRDHQEAIWIINHLTREQIEQKGRAARQRAIEQFDPNRWVTAIAGDIA